MAIALAEASIDGGVGFELTAVPSGLAPHVWLFSESASRAVVSAAPGRERALEELASAHGVPCNRIGVTGGDALRFTGMFEVSVADAVVVNEGTIPRLMSAKRVAV
jgi:phosphoribosylformylglycinamidine synthase